MVTFGRRISPQIKGKKSQLTLLQVTNELCVIFIWHLKQVHLPHLNTANNLNFNKNKYSETELKNTALAIIGERFSMLHWLHVYIDGSATGNIRNASADIYSWYFSFNRAVDAK
ncbi:hypothetical protein TNCV_5121651 [Trichonephila clavipes]|nr:hypothetical protein TNCV_5121651 [Trichonephila clavipes]